jgi:hypothetical protein
MTADQGISSSSEMDRIGRDIVDKTQGQAGSTPADEETAAVSKRGRLVCYSSRGGV